MSTLLLNRALFAALLCLPLLATSQIMTVNGAVVTVSTGATLQVNGGLNLQNTAAFTNHGTTTVSKNSTLPLAGTFSLLTNSVATGNGTYRVEQDWVNNANFTAGLSTVELFGNTQQFITSSTNTATVFNHLTLTGAGTGANRKKSLLNVNASTSPTGILTINNRELETQTNSFFVLNPAPAAVTNTQTADSEGFVSSLSPGVFSRVTNQQTVYLFPTGASAATLRYRPIEMTPTTATNGIYTVRFNNYNATTDGFDLADNDGTMCTENPLFYHSIQRLSGAPADIRMFYIAASDGGWSGMAHWRTANVQWNNMGTVGPGTNAGFQTITRLAWDFTNPGDPYILSNMRPATPEIECPTICEQSEGNVFTASGGTSYQWTFPSNGTITSGQGTASAQADWTTGTGDVSVVSVGLNGCNSQPATCQPEVFPQPNAQFSYSSDPSGVQFNDNSTGATAWDWDFGDGSGSGAENPFYQYGAGGTYSVELTVSNDGGCSATTTQLISIDERIVVPNVFSPDGDGINDFFTVTSGGLKTYALLIVNRWGNVVFESDNPSVHWDGTSNGKACEEGVYFYDLKAASGTNEYAFKGMVTLIK